MKHFHKPSNLNTIKSSNRSLVLKVLNSQGQVSRAELARITGLTKTSITNITAELLDDGLIQETGIMDSSSGRKPMQLTLSVNVYYALGIYISRDYIYANITNLKGEVTGETKQFYDLVENGQSFLNKVFESINNLLVKYRLELNQILGIGIASIGPLDILGGIILNPPNFMGLKSINIVKSIKDKFGLETFLDNDMNACALAEKLYGNAKNSSSFIYIGVTNGIGSGIYVNNSIFKGCNGFAGEIGHITIDINGERCPCGNTGCLELYAGIPAIVKQVRSLAALGDESSVSSLKNISWKDIVSAAASGDPICAKALDRLCYYLAAGLINTINSFDPEVIYLGHEIALAGELVTVPLQEAVDKNSLFRSSKQVRIELSKFRDYAPCMGAPSIVLNRFFSGEL